MLRWISSSNILTCFLLIFIHDIHRVFQWESTGNNTVLLSSYVFFIIISKSCPQISRKIFFSLKLISIQLKSYCSYANACLDEF